MERILEELARHTDDATRPDVDLYLASGPVLRGRVVKVQQGLATVHLGPAKDPSVSYVRVEQVIALTVLAGGRSARSLTPPSVPIVEGPRPPSHHDDIITPVNEMTFAAMQAAMATPTPPDELIARREELAQDRASRRGADDARRSSIERPIERSIEDPRRSSNELRLDEHATRRPTDEPRRPSSELRLDEHATRRPTDEPRRPSSELRLDEHATRRPTDEPRRPSSELRLDEHATRRPTDEPRRPSSELRLEKARADKARAEASRAELARVEKVRSGELAPRGDDVSAAFSAMRVETGSVPAPDPIAEFVASQYDVITPPDPIVPVSLELAVPRHEHLEAPTYLGERPRAKTASPASQPVPVAAPTYIGERPQPRASTPVPAALAPGAKVSPAALAAADAGSAVVESTFSMRGDTPKPRSPRTPPPSRPELMRQANTHAEMMSRVLKHRVDIAIAAPLDDDARRAIGFALPIASDVLLAMIGEPAYRAALERLASVELVAGDAEIALDPQRLVIRCSLVDRWTPASLRAAIESAVR